MLGDNDAIALRAFVIGGEEENFLRLVPVARIKGEHYGPVVDLGRNAVDHDRALEVGIDRICARIDRGDQEALALAIGERCGID